MIIGQLGDEAAGDAAGPLAVDAAVGGVDYEALMARSCDSDIGEAAFFLEAALPASSSERFGGEQASSQPAEKEVPNSEALGAWKVLVVTQMAEQTAEPQYINDH